MEVDSVRIIAILSMSYITTRIVKTDKCGKNLQSVRRKPNYYTSVAKVDMKFSPYRIEGNPILFNCSQGFTQNFGISQPS